MNGDIPKNIFLCYKHKQLPDKVIGNWQRLNPEYKIMLFDDLDCFMFIKQHYDEKLALMFKKIPDGAIRADLWRVCILYHFGGVYADADIEPLEPISSFIEEGVDFLTCRSNNVIISNSYKLQVNPHFIMSKPKSEILKLCIERYTSFADIFNQYDYWRWSIVHVIGSVFNKIVSNDTMADFHNVTLKHDLFKTINGITVQLINENDTNKVNSKQQILFGNKNKGKHFNAYNESTSEACYYKDMIVLKNRYVDYDKWSVRSNAEHIRRTSLVKKHRLSGLMVKG